MFTLHEHLVGDNQYRCSACANALCDAEKVKLIDDKNLIIERFVFVYFSGRK